MHSFFTMYELSSNAVLSSDIYKTRLTNPTMPALPDQPRITGAHFIVTTPR